jgi:hypothetical protein
MFMTTALRLWVFSKLLVSLLDLPAAFDTIDHSILLERLSAWFTITSTALSWIKFYLRNHSCYVNVEKPSHLFFSFSMVFVKDLWSDLFSSSYTPLLSVLSYLIHLQIIICVRMILHFSYHSLLLTLHTISLILNILYLMSTIEFYLIFFLWLPLRLSFFLFVFLNNSQYSVILSFICLIMSLLHVLILLVI